MNRNIAEPPMKAAWPSPASDSALPWPKRCSRSAGVKAWRTANRLIMEAAASSSESIRVESNATESVTRNATILTMISTAATATEAWVAAVIKRAFLGLVTGVSVIGQSPPHRSRIEPLGPPAISLAPIDDALVESKRALAPEFDARRCHPKARPIRWARHMAEAVFRRVLRHFTL